MSDLDAIALAYGSDPVNNAHHWPRIAAAIAEETAESKAQYHKLRSATMADNDPLNPASAAYDRGLDESNDTRDLAIEALNSAPPPHSSDFIAWVHGYSRWYHGERAEALKAVEGK